MGSKRGEKMLKVKEYVRGMIAHRTKITARRTADQARKRGRLARIVKVNDGYVVYQRKR